MLVAFTKNGWINTADSQKPAVITRARQILESTIYVTLSTSSPDGQPWLLRIWRSLARWQLYPVPN